MSVRKETIINVIVTMSKCPLTTLKVGGGGGPGGGGGGGGIGILTLVGNVQGGLVTGDLTVSTGATNTKTPAKQMSGKTPKHQSVALDHQSTFKSIKELYC